MSLLLKITLSVLTILFINGCVGVGMWFYLKRYTYLRYYLLGYKYSIISMIIMVIAICYIPFMFIWHLY